MGGDNDAAAVSRCCDVVTAFFEMGMRFFIFCPGVFAASTIMDGFVTIASKCAAGQEFEPTKATLLFLGQLLKPRTGAKWAQLSASVDTVMQAHGGRLARRVIDLVSTRCPPRLV